ncbi:TPA: phosphopyruvate hydratase [Candidatus Woesearchaeota archaeon]|nr:phosphopyruvate hydratase [Candidatus Woesearchaeota archaeon]HIH91651.1 phosphopyruvate hydratase [Candidatus Woesearchaeota archaeon]HII64803.1 phosphopyruvate hydratase [Candidatus Woesearchaeota archaeon]
MSGKILSIRALEVLDSRGNPTVKCVLKTPKCTVSAIVPSGASTGKHEALELRDGGRRYGGKGVRKAVANANTALSKAITGMDCTDQEAIDLVMLELDGTTHKSKLGANAMLAVSLAACRAGAVHKGVPLYEYIRSISESETIRLPIPQLNIINSGKHAGLENDIQEHMIFPMGFKSFSEAMRAGVETYHQLKAILRKKYGAQATLLGDEGGFAPPIADVNERLTLIMDAISQAGYGKKIKLGLDCASSEFFKNGTYTLGKKSYASAELIDVYRQLSKAYPLVSIEDGMAEDDWEGWAFLTKQLGNRLQLVGDDLLVTNEARIKRAIQEKSCNALLLKVNQIGTVTESIEAANLCVAEKWNVVVSHRSGETEDDFIADLVAGLGASQSKFGAPARSDRVAKYNRLLEIEQELGRKAKFGN